MKIDTFVLFVLLIVWLVSAIVAATIAYGREQSAWTWGVVTFLFLGPIGPGFALIAPHGAVEDAQVLGRPDSQPKTPEGRRHFVCPRCVADNYIPEADTSYECWRCSEHRRVKPKPSSQASTPD
jgi:DNA-directed RNA polymerase subunit RPC12/RpoP